MVTTADTVLLAYNEKHVLVKDAEMEENTTIAMNFVRTFVNWVQDDYHLNLELVKQGSSFEGLKVDKADEYDFLFGFKPSNRSHHYIPRRPHPLRDDVNNMKKSSCSLNCYNPVLMSGTEEPILDCTTETWPRMKEEYKVMSARLSIRFIQFLLITFENTLRRTRDINQKAGRYFPSLLPGIAKIDPPVVENPALKTVLHKHNGSTICIDTSPAVRLLCPDTKRKKICIAKKKPVLRGMNDDRIRLLWLDCFSEEEMTLISKKREYEKRNFRIVKRAFRDVIGISYIWKTLFMLQDEPFPVSPYEFMMTMVRKLKTSIDAELQQRNGDFDDFGHCSLSGGHLLKTRFNQGENILERYDDDQLENWNEKLNDLMEHDAAGRIGKLLLEVLGNPTLNQLLHYVNTYRR